MCSKELSGTYDARAVDLWAAGVTLYSWISGQLPFVAPTVMLLMDKIAKAPAKMNHPPEASEALGRVIEGLLTRDVSKRLTLAQLRLDNWLTDSGAQPLPVQPVVKIQVTEADIAQAVSNRAAIAIGSAAGPSNIGAALALVGQSHEDTSGGWVREGVATIRKRSTNTAADFWRSIAASGHLAPHLPIIYSITPVDEDDNGQVDVASDGTLTFDIRMQDLTAAMTRPCAMGFVMGCRTVTSQDMSQTAPRPELLEAMKSIDANAPTAEEVEAGGVSVARYLGFLDSVSSTASLGFRIDNAKTMVDSSLSALPLPETVSLSTLRDEGDLTRAMCTFLQQDASLALAVLRKVQTLLEALLRSPFLTRHVLLRSRLLLVYDDANREALLELKMMNFVWSCVIVSERFAFHPPYLIVSERTTFHPPHLMVSERFVLQQLVCENAF